ncbi:hypothetical protein DNTS_020486 [Danionella cerebrum]|uniref:Myb/SANT-like DNA-binding domain-containing protein n=1 Tax=Danionella cerebrum TaxID=2873325 RepID=A0A553Q4K6_9TELE|nr:hypothetical protein DNTS_020486 [Danionella translucida]
MEIVPSSLPSSLGCSSRDSQAPHEAVSSSSEFPPAAVVLLISSMGRCSALPLSGSRGRSLLFRRLQGELEAHGHRFSVERIRRKWNNLIVTYKRVRERQARGRVSTSWEYFQMMDSILRETAFVQRGHSPGSASALDSATLFGCSASVSVTPQPESDASANVNASSGSPASPPSAVCATEAIPLPLGQIISNPPLIPELPKLKPKAELKPMLEPKSVLVRLKACRSKLMPSLEPEHELCRIKPVQQVSESEPLLEPPMEPEFKDRCQVLQLDSPNFAVAQDLDEQTVVLKNVCTLQGECDRYRVQQHSRTEAHERRKGRQNEKMVVALEKMATTLELISSKQDTVIALLQRIADKHKNS